MANFDPFEQDFRQRANGLKLTPNPKTWDRLERRLDRRSRNSGMRIFGVRPWLLAAMVLLTAGAFVLMTAIPTTSSPLAQRAESVEDIDAAFQPIENFDVELFREQLRQDAPAVGDDVPAADFRDVVVAEKYRT